MPRLTYIDPETKEQRYVRPANDYSSDQFQSVPGWMDKQIQALAAKRRRPGSDVEELRVLMMNQATGDIKGVVERAAPDIIVEWEKLGGFGFSRVMPQLDEMRCTDSGDIVYGQLPPELAVPKAANYPQAVDIHRGEESQIEGKQWIPLLREIIEHGESLQQGMRERIDVIVRRGRLTASDDQSLFEMVNTNEFDSFYSFIRGAGITHKKSGNYLSMPLLNLEQWMQRNGLILLPDIHPPACPTQSDRKSTMNIEGKMSIDDISGQLDSLFGEARSADTKQALDTVKKHVSAFEKKIAQFREIYDKNEITDIDKTIDGIRTLINTRVQVLAQR